MHSNKPNRLNTVLTTKDREPNLSRGLDFYKLTMGDMAYEKHPEIEVTFTLKNRNSHQPLGQYVEPDALQLRLDRIRAKGFTVDEIGYYASLKAQDGEARFTADYLDHIAQIQLPAVTITKNETTSELNAQTCGPWTDVSLWETVIMSEINEEYYTNFLQHHDLQLEDIYAQGNARLDTKIQRLSARPDIKFADFGTRRRFSADWHEHVIERLTNELPNNFIGTSNPWFAYKYGIAPIGTFAHEMPMVYAGLEDAQGNNPLNGHHKMLTDWEQHYRGDLSIALTDTFGSDFFFADFSKEQAESWRGLRHDSGDPIKFGERVLEFYKENEVDPRTKTLVFSDGLDIDKIEELADYFAGRINLLFGWGTSLMNDVGLPSNNFVVKATHIATFDGREAHTVKLSDDEGKHTGPAEKVLQYQLERDRKIGKVVASQVSTA